MGIIEALVMGAIAGWLAGLIVRGAGFGLIGNIVIGIIGASQAGCCRSWASASAAARFATSSTPPSAALSFSSSSR